MSFGSFIRRLASPAISTKQTQPKDPRTAGLDRPHRSPGKRRRARSKARPAPSANSCCPPRCAVLQLQRCICPAENQTAAPKSPSAATHSKYTPEAEKKCGCQPCGSGWNLHTLNACPKHSADQLTNQVKQWIDDWRNGRWSVQHESAQAPWSGRPVLEYIRRIPDGRSIWATGLPVALITAQPMGRHRAGSARSGKSNLFRKLACLRDNGWPSAAN